MSEVGKEVLFAIRARADQYQTTLAKLPGWTQDAAKKASAAWEKTAVADAARTAAGIKSSADEASKAWGAAGKKVAELAGGPFSQLGQVIAELVPNSAAAVGGLGNVAGAAAGIGVAAAGITLAAGATWKLAEAGSAAEERLRKAGRASELPPGAVRGIEEYRRTTEELRVAWDKLLVTWGADAGRTISGLVSEVDRLRGGWTAWGRELLGSQEGVERFTAGTARMRDAFVAVGSLGLVPLARYLRDVGAAAEEARPKVEALSDAAVDMSLREAEAEEARRKASAERGARQIEEARKQAAAEAKARAAEARRAEEELQAALAETRDYYWQREADQRRGVTESLAAMDEARLDAEKEAAEKRKDLAKEVAAEQIAQARSAAAETARGLDELVGEIERIQENMREGTRRVLDGLVDVGRGTQDLLFTLAENGTRKQKKAAEQFARYMRSVEIAQTLILGIRAVAQAAASAPPPFNLPAIAAATLDAGARMTSLLATKIPTAYSGRPGSGTGDAPVLAHRGESILTSRDTQALLRLLSERLSPLAALEGLAAPAAAAPGGGDVYLDRRKVGRVLTRGGPPPGYRRPAR